MKLVLDEMVQDLTWSDVCLGGWNEVVQDKLVQILEIFS
jgi:hypothetical protein